MLGFAVVVLVHVLHARQGGPLSPQSGVNAHFAGKPSLAGALRAYPKVWPPLYPTLLWTGGRVGLSPEAVNEGLLLAAMALFAGCLVRLAPAAGLAVPMLLMAALNAHYVNAQQLTAEPLVVVLLLALLLALDAYRRAPDARTLLVVAGVCAALFLARYFTLFFVAPVVALEIARARGRAPRERLAHGALALLVSLPLAGAWLAYAYAQTGFLTGTDRFEARAFREGIRDWGELTTFGANLRLTAKTAFIDGFSPSAYASHAVVNDPYAPHPVEWALLVLALAGAAGAIAATRRAWRREATLFPTLALAVFYMGMLIALWTLGNNDPVYTRFLYPVYPLVLLLAVAGAARARQTWPASTALYAALALGLVAVQAVRAWRALELPLR